MTAALALRLAVTPLALVTFANAAVPAQQADDGLGRLFMTPQKRAILDDMRQRNARINVEQQSTDTVRLDGIVRRSDGRNVVWINGQSHYDHAPVASLGESSARVFAGNGRSIDLRVGETVHLAPASTELAK